MELLKQPQKPMKLISSMESLVNKMYPFQTKSREIEFPDKKGVCIILWVFIYYSICYIIY